MVSIDCGVHCHAFYAFITCRKEFTGVIEPGNRPKYAHGVAFHRRSAIELVKIRGTNPERTFKGSELWGSIGLWRRPIFLRF